MPMSKISAEDAAKRWDEIAEIYAELTDHHGDINKEVLLTPTFLDMLGDVAGKRVLDAGCGEGFLSRLVAKRGASVLAVDLAEKMLTIARERTPIELEIDYRHANLENLDGLQSGSFDLVLSSMVIQDLPDYEAAIAEIFRVLRSGGRCVMAVAHPCFSSDGAWERDDEGNKLYWRTDNYFNERPIEQSGPPKAKRKPYYFHRTLTSYFRTLKSAGFQIIDLLEPVPSAEAIEKYPHFIDDLRMTHFLIFNLKKA
jgi:ubiquinone/menaquinone biosynthesis C-methylase UbiE